MRIGELARRTGVSERSLRYYEQQGLLTSDRSPSGQRIYSEWAVDRVVHIQHLFAAGVGSKTVSALLPCMRDVDGRPSANATEKLSEVLTTERARVDEAIRNLQRSRDTLDEIIDAATCESE
ncbi:MerR family transcriptional regulator [Rhodococcus sp. 14-2483-1-1]|uniref:MerR family transcriptional regulator n=1 Tax=Rhodococcus sp. 14-2483-1-1 TaxID=2023148 RepID=UPI000B9BB55E|nr:MerR family transcriptional regulator [Rhodococcus sp. 14-2483-1-1]OZF36505.1 MerR family transcriptional regulator [Rhodococcus sp. 14-2483-1-1]